MEKSIMARATKSAKTSRKSKSSKTETEFLLTEEQIKQMSEDEYMNDLQLAFFKDRLKKLESDILNNADVTTENLRETQFVPDPADRATIEEEHTLELRTRDRERKLLKKVQNSLQLIESKEYGWCEETGEPIGIPRLLARPTATLSLEAQERREKRQKLYND
ncbi:RNA polymerase-binding protein DksA [Taylorella asinigenitalis]|nr:RNA polymerase-binding protein DksA [Taylorella asinigenitalis]